MEEDAFRALNYGKGISMAQIDTRHDERDMLFSLLVARATNDFDTLIERVIAKMEDEDVKRVEGRFAEWEKKR